MLGLLHCGEQDPCPDRIGPERIDHGFDRPLHDVVGQHDEHRIAPDETLGQAKCFGDAARLLLIPVGEPVDAELVAVAQQAQELPGMGAAGHQHDLVDSGIDERLYRPGDHRTVVDREQMLVGDAGQGVEARARTARQEHTFHRRRPRRADRVHFHGVSLVDGHPRCPRDERCRNIHVGSPSSHQKRSGSHVHAQAGEGGQGVDYEVVKTEDEWKRELPADRYAVLRRAGTEPAWSGELLHVEGEGVFRCAGCGAELFDTGSKFESGTGWPSFDRATSDGYDPGAHRPQLRNEAHRDRVCPLRRPPRTRLRRRSDRHWPPLLRQFALPHLRAVSGLRALVGSGATRRPSTTSKTVARCAA